MDLAFVIDGSESISRADPGNWQKVLEFVASFVDFYVVRPGSTRVALVQFSDIGVIEFNFTTYSTAEEVKQAILGVQIRNSFTNTHDGIVKMRQLFTPAFGDRPDVSNVAVILTDGEHSRETPDPVPEAERAQGEGITMLAVGVAQANREELKGLSSEPKKEYETYWMQESFDDLAEVIGSLRSTSCTKPSELRCKAGW